MESKINKEEESLEFVKLLSTVEVIIFHLDTSNHNVIQFVLNSLVCLSFSHDISFIVISSVFTLACTPPKIKIEGEQQILLGDEPPAEGEQPVEEEEEPEEEAEPENEEDKKEEEEPQEENQEPEAKRKILPFKEEDFYKRIPDNKYMSHKSIETLAMSSIESKKNLHIYVICSGILYGSGEQTFYEYFKRSWLQNPTKLPIVGKGKNIVPTIHLIDLARLILRVIKLWPKSHYILAIDKAKKSTQKDIIQAIANSMGSTQVEHCPLFEVNHFPFLLPLQINLKMKASSVFNDEPVPESEANEELDDQELEKRANERKFKWHSENGIVGSITTLNNEFNNFRDLKPVKVFITGPPASWKKYYSKILSNIYNIPIITVLDIVEKAKNLQGELGDEIRGKLEELKTQMLDDYENLPPKEKKLVDPSKLEPHVPDEFLYKVLRLKLQENVCRNRGYILTGFPRNFQDGLKVFLIKQKKEGEDDNQDEQEINYEEMIIDNSICPSNIIVLKCSDEFLTKRIMDMTEAQTKNSHFNQKDLKRRLKQYKDANCSADGSPSIQQLFKSRGIDIIEINADNPISDMIIGRMKLFIERNGKPKNYLNEEEVVEKKRVEKFNEFFKEKIDKEDDAISKKKKIELELRSQREDIDGERLQDKIKEENRYLKEKAEPLFNYIDKSIGPILIDALREVCEKNPPDPISYMAKYFFKRSLDVYEPLPSVVKQ